MCRALLCITQVSELAVGGRGNQVCREGSVSGVIVSVGVLW